MSVSLRLISLVLSEEDVSIIVDLDGRLVVLGWRILAKVRQIHPGGFLECILRMLFLNISVKLHFKQRLLGIPALDLSCSHLSLQNL